MFRDLSPRALNFFRSKSLNFLLLLTLCIKTTNDLGVNDFKLSRFAFEVRQKFEAVPRRVEILSEPVRHAVEI